MIGMVNKKQKEAAEKILNGDYSRAGFFLEVGEEKLPESEWHEIVKKRAREFLNEN